MERVDHLDRLTIEVERDGDPHHDPSALFVDNPALAENTAFRNGTLQAGYLILAARLLGLDAGPMSGFDAAKLYAEFFPDGRVRSNILIALGHADGPPARAPRAWMWPKP